MLGCDVSRVLIAHTIVTSRVLLSQFQHIDVQNAKLNPSAAISARKICVSPRMTSCPLLAKIKLADVFPVKNLPSNTPSGDHT